MSFAADLEAAAKSAVCGWLANGGNAMAASWLVKGAKTPATSIASAASGLGLLAVNYACNFDSGTTTNDGSWSGSICTQAGGITYMSWTGQAPPGTPRYNLKISDIGVRTDWPAWIGQSRNGITYQDTTAAGVLRPPTTTTIEPNKQWIFSPGAGCTSSGTGGLPVAPLPPHTYTSPTTNCTYVVSHQAFVSRDDGTVSPVLKIEPAAQAMASGGIIGGCNFGPVLYVPGGGGGTVIPWEPGPDGPDGEPWWWPLVRGALGAVAGELVEWLLDQFRPSMADLIAERLVGDKTGLLPAVVYDLTEACPPDGAEPQVHEVPIPQAPALAGLAARSDALEVLAQDQKSWNQPTCRKAPLLTGELVTINFQSNPAEVPSRYAIKKHLSYRDQSGRDEEFHLQHWEGFSWDTGAAIVTSRGLPWGVVQVWAVNNAEGQRVIAHAATAAGVNLNDPKHEWEFGTTNHPRYGRQGTVWPVKWDESGKLMISKRDGPAGLPGYKRDPGVP